MSHCRCIQLTPIPWAPGQARRRENDSAKNAGLAFVKKLVEALIDRAKN